MNKGGCAVNLWLLSTGWQFTMSHEELTKESVIRRLLSERAVLLGYVRSLGLDEHLAEDVLQNVCIVVIEKYEQAKNWEHFGAWVRLRSDERRAATAKNGPTFR
jgi:hypothetical protein